MSLLDMLRRGPAVDDARWVVLDVESSGLDASRDRLLAIAALAVRVDGRRAAIALGDSFEIVLRSESATPDKANILVHGIGVGAQRAGVDPAEALAAFERWIGASPLLAFHAAFDQTLIGRGFGAALGRRLPNPWLDIAPLAELLHPQVAARSLDEWMQHFGIVCAQRHQAAADTLATAELLLRLWPALLKELPQPRFAAAARLAAQRRWVGR
jgi:DNA polymerase-3 subunit epsilon